MCRNVKVVVVFGVTLSTTFLIAPAKAQSHSVHAPQGLGDWFALLEIPFLAGCVIFAFLTASALKGGRFGTGMHFLAWGFLVMAVGHVHMQVEALTGVNLFGAMLGAAGGTWAWMIALVLTWTLSGIGFYNVYRASR